MIRNSNFINNISKTKNYLKESDLKMEKILDLKQQIEKDYDKHSDWYYGTVIIIRKNEKDIIVKFNDINGKITNKLIKQRKETINWSHKGTHLGKLISTNIKANETVVFKNINFTSYDTIQCDFLLRGLFKDGFNSDIWKP